MQKLGTDFADLALSVLLGVQRLLLRLGQQVELLLALLSDLVGLIFVCLKPGIKIGYNT